MKKIGLKRGRTQRGKILVLGVEPGSVAEKMGFRSGDEIISIGRKTGKRIPLDEPGGLEFRPGRKVRVRRDDGEIVELVVPPPLKTSAEYRALNKELDRPDVSAHRVVQQIYAAVRDGVLPEPEAQRLHEKANRIRSRRRRAGERELPLGQSPAMGFGPEGNRFHDEQHLKRQIAEDIGLSRRGRHIVSIVSANHLHTTPGPAYFTAWPSIATLRKQVRCSRAAVHDAILEVAARGHWRIIRRGGNQTNILAFIRKDLAHSAALSEMQRPQPTAREEAPAIEQGAEPETAPPSGLTAEQEAAIAAGAAIPLRRSPIAIAAGTPPLRLARQAPDERVTPESEARRVAEIDRREAEAAASEARAAYIDWLWKNQARSEPLFESNYNPGAHGNR